MNSQLVKHTLLVFSLLMGVFTLGVFVGMFLLETGYVPSIRNQASSIESIQTGNALEKQEITIDISIDYGNGDIQSFPQELMLNGSTVLDVLNALERRYGIALETRNFPGVGVFIEAIHGVRNSNTSYWQFWVNGEYAQVGAAQYVVQDGDKVLWKRTSEIPYRPL